VPKQFCSLRGGASLLDEALARGEAVTSRSRVLAVVAGCHRRWWEGALRSLPPDNVIVQPENKGTAAGLLLPLLHIVTRDPEQLSSCCPPITSCMTSRGWRNPCGARSASPARIAGTYFCSVSRPRMPTRARLHRAWPAERSLCRAGAAVRRKAGDRHGAAADVGGSHAQHVHHRRVGTRVAAPVRGAGSAIPRAHGGSRGADRLGTMMQPRRANFIHGCRPWIFHAMCCKGRSRGCVS